MSNTQNERKTPQSIDEHIKKLQIEKSLLLDKYLTSRDPESIVKAQAYLQSMDRDKPNPKAYFFPFDAEYNNGKEWKDTMQSIPDNILRKVSYIHIIDLIITTKINQIHDFFKFQTDDQKEGFTIRRKLSRFQDRNKSKEPSKQEQKTIESLVDFLENGGDNAKWDMHDGIMDFTSKIVRDSYTFNRMAVELERNLKGDLLRYVALDAQTVRYLNTIDPFYETKNPNSKFIKRKFQEKEYLPRFCQIWQGQIVENPMTQEQIVWYPWELAFEIRNKSTDIWRNGYGVSEIETLAQIITWLLNGLSYNGNFFSQGSNPKGILNVKNGDGGGQGILNSLRQMWTTSIAGVNNAHRMPVVEGLDLEFIDMHHSNKDMEFQFWNEFLIVLTCAVFTIDLSELGFNFKTQSQMFGQQGQKERLEHSKDKGLKPMLIFLQKFYNKYLISELVEDYEFVFTGVDLEDETLYLDNDVKKVGAGFVSMEDMFEKYSHRRPTDKDTILNPVYLQSKQMAMYGGQGMNEAVDEMTGEPNEGVSNPFEEFDTEKSQQNDPIWAEAKNWLQKSKIL